MDYIQLSIEDITTVTMEPIIVPSLYSPIRSKPSQTLDLQILISPPSVPSRSLMYPTNPSKRLQPSYSDDTTSHTYLSSIHQRAPASAPLQPLSSTIAPPHTTLEKVPPCQHFTPPATPLMEIQSSADLLEIHSDHTHTSSPAVIPDHLLRHPKQAFSFPQQQQKGPGYIVLPSPIHQPATLATPSSPQNRLSYSKSLSQAESQFIQTPPAPAFVFGSNQSTLPLSYTFGNCQISTFSPSVDAPKDSLHIGSISPTPVRPIISRSRCRPAVQPAIGSMIPPNPATLDNSSHNLPRLRARQIHELDQRMKIANSKAMRRGSERLITA